jgi:flagellar basal body rod protein FlgB
VLDPTMQAIQSARDGLAARQRNIAQNPATSETSGFLTQTVDFEVSLNLARPGRPSREVQGWIDDHCHAS